MRPRVLTSVGTVSLLLALFATSFAAGAQANASRYHCGTERWSVKILADSDNAKVTLTPLPSSVSKLGDIPVPVAPLPADRRLAPHELNVFRVHVTVTQSLVENDQDWHLVLRDTEDSTRTMIGEIPDSACAIGSGWEHAYAEARRSFRAVPRGAVIEVDGVGFWDFQHGQRGRAPNGFELHPILAIRTLGATP